MSDIIDERVKSFWNWIEDTHKQVDTLDMEELDVLITKCKGFTTKNCMWPTYDTVQYILERAIDRYGDLEYEDGLLENTEG